MLGAAYYILLLKWESWIICARVVELVDTQVSEACAAMHASSSLASGTINDLGDILILELSAT